MPIRDLLRNVLSRSNGLYPLATSNTRALPEDYKGPVITSDIDRTYLESSIHSLRGLVRTALEPADQKRAFIGMVPLYQALRHGPESTQRATPLYFVSASPPQMEDVLREKMQIDGIEVDGLTFKDQVKLVFKGRWRELRKHIIYKLTALLLNRSTRPTTAEIEEVLIGDDSETDAEAYLLYARILEGAITPDGLGYILEGFGVQGKKRDVLMALAARRDQSRVAKIYIHCTTRRNPAALFAKDTRLLTAMDSLQIGLDAFQHGWIQRDALHHIAKEMGPEATQSAIADAHLRNLFEPVFLDTQREFIQSFWPNETPGASKTIETPDAAIPETAAAATTSDITASTEHIAEADAKGT